VRAEPGAGPAGAESRWVAEASRLFTSLHEAIAESASTHAGADPGTDHVGGTADPPPLTCRYCPLCQALALARRNAPEMLDQLAALASTLADALRAGNSGSRTDGAEEPPAPPGPERAPPHLEWIDITE